MKKIFLTFLSIFLVIVVLVGCSPNEKGFMGPSWDIPLRAPLMKDKEFTLDDLLEGAPDEINDTEEVISFNSDLSSEVDLPKYSFVDIFSEDVIIPDFDFGDGSISLPTIDSNISGTESLSEVPIDGSYDGTTLDDKLDITLGLPDTFESLTFGSDKNIEIELSLQDNVDTVVEDFNITFGDGTYTIKDSISAGETANGKISLNNLTLESGEGFSTSITTSGNDEAQLNLKITFPSYPSLSKVEGLKVENKISKEINPDNISFNSSELPEGVKSISFEDGSNIKIGLDTTLENYIDYNLNFFNFSDDDNDGYIDLATEKLDIAGSTTPYLDFGVSLNIPAGDIIDYSTDPIKISGDLTNNGIESATINFDNFNLGDKSTINEKVIFDKETMDIPDEIKNLEFNNAKFTLGLDGITDLTMDLIDLTFKALDSNGKVVQENNSDLKFNLGEITGDSGEIELMDKDPNVLDLILNENTQEVVVNGSWDLEGEATIDENETIGFNGMTVDIPFSFNIEEDINHTIVPSPMDPFDADQIDIIEQGVKEAKVVINEFNNEMGISIDAEIYLGTISGGAQMNDTELKEELYKEDNILKTVSIEQRKNKDIEFGITDAEVDKFTKNNLYTGVKIIIPNNTGEKAYELRTGDKINIGEIFVTMIGKANQYDF